MELNDKKIEFEVTDIKIFKCSPTKCRLCENTYEGCCSPIKCPFCGCLAQLPLNYEPDK
jgi:hypothetical protein